MKFIRSHFSHQQSMKRSANEGEDGVSLAGPWKKLVSQKHNRVYWYNEGTKQSVWEDPTAAAQLDAQADKKVKLQMEEPAIENSNTQRNWKKAYSERYQRDYWFDEANGEKRWDDPNECSASGAVPSNQKKIDLMAVYTTPEEITEALERERKAVAVDAPTCPREIDTADLAHIVHRLRTESAVVVEDKNPMATFPVVFRLADDDTAMITRAVQEDQILKTRLKVQDRDGVKDLLSFWDVWEKDAEFRSFITSAADPNEEKWKCQRTHNYKIATTFMPGYAKAIYEHYQAQSGLPLSAGWNVLDPCAGWGDRLVGAASSSIVTKYVCFDPNTTLRPGYAALMKLYGHACTEVGPQGLKFSNGFECRTQPFEVGALVLQDNSFDVVFTSPPFFDYEMYNPDNPQYVDWIKEFYVPLFVQACRCVKPGHFVCIHIGDTSAGNIEKFLKTEVQRICSLKLVSRVGLHGMMSQKTRTVWIFQKKKL